MRILLTSLVTGLLLAGAALSQEETSVSREEGLENWAKVYEVLSHPRCANCHVPEDGRPRWSGPSYGLAEGEWTYHGMNIHGGDSRDGAGTLPCSTCHTEENSEVPHGPPGAHVWALAPVEMVWWQKSSQFICEQLQDPNRNGGRSLQDVADHIDHDELVHWGWSPGPGREPAPYSIEETVSFVEAWAAAGAPCPADAETPAPPEEPSEDL